VVVERVAAQFGGLLFGSGGHAWGSMKVSGPRAVRWPGADCRSAARCETGR
jgi:hypothetical protein